MFVRITSYRVNGNGSKEMGRIGLLWHGSNLHRFGIGSNGLGSTLKNAKFKGDNILISTQVHSTKFDLSQFDLSYSTKRVDLILFDLFHSTHFMQSPLIVLSSCLAHCVKSILLIRSSLRISSWLIVYANSFTNGSTWKPTRRFI